MIALQILEKHVQIVDVFITAKNQGIQTSGYGDIWDMFILGFVSYTRDYDDSFNFPEILRQMGQSTNPQMDSLDDQDQHFLWLTHSPNQTRLPSAYSLHGC